ncbi:hypothetical protein [Paraburkholderia sp. ZP32-5]|uniref:hypothetical protein n=1 Tax=Paraburkholderia sp. ZP32-5 TaxID=2883245 RepID=UPI001F2ADB10|nr:hypothetical protein [Paraburkholderia sp. ZP32-5]
MTKRAALMLALMEPPPGLEEEFADWYDTEHLPQRRGLPGFVNGMRWVALEGFPKSLASYDLASLDALADPAYLAVSGANSTPWSRRLLARTARAGRMRVEVEQIWPGTATFLPPRKTARLLAARYADVPVQQQQAFADAANALAKTLPGLAQLRVFAGVRDAATELWVLMEFGAPVTLSMLAPVLGRIAGYGADVFNLYAPYDRDALR